MSPESASSNTPSVDSGGESGYSYNANDDALAEFAKNFTSRFGDGSGDIEQDFLSALDLLGTVKAGGDFLDIGSGLGRIVGLLRPYAGSLVGLEPDRSRFDHCHSVHHGRGPVEVLNLDSGAMRERVGSRRFDLITVSMVVQHVSTRVCDSIFADVRALLGQGGLAIVATTHSSMERFTFQHDATPCSRETFDAYASDTSNQHSGIPVRMFSRQSFEEAVERAGLKIVVWRQFSYVRPEKLEGLANLFKLDQEGLRDFAISQYAILEQR